MKKFSVFFSIFLMCGSVVPTYGMLSYFSRNKNKKEKPIVLREKVADLPVSDDLKNLLKSDKGSNVAIHVDYLWSLMEKQPKEMQQKLSQKISGISYIGGIANFVSNQLNIPEKMVNYLLTPKVWNEMRDLFQKVSDVSLEKRIHEKSPIIFFRLKRELKKTRQREKEKVVEKVTRFSAGQMLQCIYDHNKDITKAMCEKAPSFLMSPFSSFLKSCAKDGKEWKKFYASLAYEVYKKDIWAENYKRPE